tara:strand:- start:91157 stop:91612 length:456 start_codon:yes stop_codon:yes gene_type:complete
MSDEQARWCVLLPCSAEESWAVPQNCLAEIVTLQVESDEPPSRVRWRGEPVPVLDFGADGDIPWWEERRGTGLIAIFRGLKGEGCDFWGVAIRGGGLGVENIAGHTIEDAPDAAAAYSTSAFRLQQKTYQVPDLAALQKDIAASLELAAEA